MSIPRSPLAFLLLLLAAGLAPAQILLVYEPVVTEGDAVPGVGAITRIDNLAVNGSGRWLVEADTDNGDTNTDQVVIRNGSLYLREGQLLPNPPGAGINSFDSINLNETDQSGWNFFLEGTGGVGDDSGIYRDTTLVIQEGDTSAAAGFSPGTPYIGFFDAKINDSRQIMLVATVDDPAIASGADRALVRLDLDGSGGLLAETVVAKEGDVLPGQTEGIADFGTGPHQSAFTNGGVILYFADLTGATDRDGVIYLNQTLLAQEGGSAPVPGRTYDLLSSRGLDVNNEGEYVFKASMDGATTDDDILVKNGAVFAREGEGLPDIAPYQITGLGTSSGPVQIADDGSVLWYGQWNDPNPDRDTGLFLDSTLIVREGSTIGMDVIDAISSGQDGFSMSDNGEWCIFEATFLTGENTAILRQLTDPTGIAGPEGRGVPSILKTAPNPFLSEARISFGLAAEEAVRLDLFDVRGRLVRTLADEMLPAGFHALSWAGRDGAGRSVPPGTYFLRLRTKENETVRRIVHVR